MIFNGLNIWFVVLAAASGIAALITAHLLKVRLKKNIVPTIMFWQAAIADVNKNRLWGRLSEFKTLLLLIAVLLGLSIIMLKPAIDRGNNRVIIIDISSVTDLKAADRYAREILNHSDKCSLLAVGKNSITQSNFGENYGSILSALTKLQSDDNGYSAVADALVEAQALTSDNMIYVISGQDLNLPREVNYIACRHKNVNLPEESFSISSSKKYSQSLELYCQADDRFCYTADNDADIVLTDSELEKIDWDSLVSINEFIEFLSGKAEIARTNKIVPVETEKTKASVLDFDFDYDLYAVLVICVLFAVLTDIYLFKKNKIS